RHHHHRRRHHHFLPPVPSFPCPEQPSVSWPCKPSFPKEMTRYMNRVLESAISNQQSYLLITGLVFGSKSFKFGLLAGGHISPSSAQFLGHFPDSSFG